MARAAIYGQRPMQRVMIIGQPGSGKSTLARNLGAVTDLPVVHIDLIHWQPGWVERSKDEKTRLCREVHAQERWIFEGGHSATWPERLERADTLIWIDMGVTRRFWRVLRRLAIYYGTPRPDMPEGCPESFGPHTLEFWRYIWSSRRKMRAQMAKTFAAAEGKARHRLTGNRAIRNFLTAAAQSSHRYPPPERHS